LRIKRIRADAFGVLNNCEYSMEDNDIVVVFGRNEAGKSTLFNLIYTILYGFKPSSRDNNRYVPWGESMALCEAEIDLSDGSAITVSRKLMSSAMGKIVREGNVIEIGNRPVPELEHLPFEVFSEVFALCIDDMYFLGNSSWKMVQDRLLGGQYTGFLNSVSSVIEGVEQNASQLWRTDRRGKPKSREIDDKIHELLGELKTARENEAEIRKQQQILIDKEKELLSVRDEKVQLRAAIQKYEYIYPLKKQVHRANQLKEIAGQVSCFDSLPKDPEERVKEIEVDMNMLKQEKDKLNERKNILKDKILRYSIKEERVVKSSNEIKTLIKASERIKSDTIERRSLFENLFSNEQKLHFYWNEIMDEEINKNFEKKVESLNLSLIRDKMDKFKIVDLEFQNGRITQSNLKEHMKKTMLPPFTPAISAAVFLLGIIGVLKAGNIYPSFIAGLFGAILIILWWYLNKSDRYNIRDYEEKNAKLNKERDTIVGAIREELTMLPFPQKRIELPDERLISDITRLKEMIFEISEIKNKIFNLDKRLEKDKTNIDAVFNMTGEHSFSGSLIDKINYLEIRLDECAALCREKEEASFELKLIEMELFKTVDAYNQFKIQKNQILSTIEQIAGNTLNEKGEELKRQRSYRNSFEVIMENIHREYPNVEDIINESGCFKDPSMEGITEEEIYRMKEETQILEDRTNCLMEEIGTLKKDIELRIKRSLPSEIEGELSYLRDRRLSVVQERDRLILLKNVLLEADRVYREEHQPDVLKRAGEYLNTITQSRYDRLIMDEEGSKLVEVREYASGKTREIDFLSRGTREQVYLALRLALAEHLDPHGHSLPLIMDEVLINWDETRLEQGLNIIKNISQKRQVFIFTCHDWLVERIKSLDHVKVVVL